MQNNNTTTTQTNVFEHYVASKHQIYLDATALMSSDFTPALRLELKRCLKAYHWKLCIPAAVKNEVSRLVAMGNTPAIRTAANNARGFIEGLEAADLVSCYGGMRGVGVNEILVSLISENRSKFPILLITQDRSLASTVLRSGHSAANRTVVLKFSAGALDRHFTAAAPAKPQPAPQPVPQPAPQPAPKPVPQPAPKPAPQPAPKPAPQPAPLSTRDTKRIVSEIASMDASFTLERGYGVVHTRLRKVKYYNFILEAKSSRDVRIDAYVVDRYGYEIPIRVSALRGGYRNSIEVKYEDLPADKLSVVLQVEYSVGKFTKRETVKLSIAA